MFQEECGKIGSPVHNLTLSKFCLFSNPLKELMETAKLGFLFALLIKHAFPPPAHITRHSQFSYFEALARHRLGLNKREHGMLIAAITECELKCSS